MNYKLSHPRRQRIHDNSGSRVVEKTFWENLIGEVRFDENFRIEAPFGGVVICELHYKGFTPRYRRKVKGDNGTNVSYTYCLQFVNSSSILQIEFSVPIHAWRQSHTESGAGFPDLESKAVEAGSVQHE